MVLEAIFGDGFVRDEEAEEAAGAADGGGGGSSYVLVVLGETSSNAELQVKLHVCYAPEYPSHLPPKCAIVEGIDDAEEATFVVDSLRALFYEERAVTAAEGEPAEGVVHKWSEWVRDEWISMQK